MLFAVADLEFRQRSDATDLRRDTPCILAHVISDTLTWGLGFTQAIESRWPRQSFDIASRLRHLSRADLGEVIWSPLEPGILLAHLVAERSFGRQDDNLELLALRQTLVSVAQRACTLEVSVHLPALGTGLCSAPGRDVCSAIRDELVGRGVSAIMHFLGSHRPIEYA